MAASKVIPDRGVVLAWSPLAANGGVLATGVKEGGGGGFEEYGGDLTLHGVDMGSPSQHCPTLGRCVRARGGHFSSSLQAPGARPAEYPNTHTHTPYHPTHARAA